MKVAAMLMISLALVACGDKQPTQAAAVNQGNSQSVANAYTTIEEWSLPNGGFGKAILVDPSYREEKAMLELAEQIKLATAQDRNAYVFIYDDKVAASNRKAALDGSLSKSDLAHHDDHLISSYQRNANSGYHALDMSLQGFNGPIKQIGF